MKWLPLVLATVPLLSHSSVFNSVHGCNIREDSDMWALYKQQFVTSDGRVVDNSNNSISHSESQGYGMVMATFFHDHASFRAIWRWTQQTLQRDSDQLFSWKWQSATPHIPDRNNASDGDIFIAWALLKAEEVWPGNRYREQAAAIINALADTHLVTLDKHTALLPAGYGFEHPSSTVVNPSYWVYPAFNDFAKFNARWQSLNDGGMKILEKSQFGQHALPSDWIEYRNNQWEPAQQFPPRFSYASYRIPLYLIWGGYDNAINDHYRSWLKKYNRAWVDVETNTMANYRAPSGANAIAALVQLSNEDYKHRSVLPEPTLSDDYYSASLIIFSHIAFYERYCQ
ncbi:endoglucanase [Photobacterium aquae]|uniref:Glucanase n=1 Tax=Photobacterium aquae TaxID=1195763 RepID=A0A0J1GV03_9GAMM|nr:glycosyl hydrolase family 8 [Photobacterium aquae]KLV03583.1 endoglucanase [Photobacterium aquae]